MAEVKNKKTVEEELTKIYTKVRIISNYLGDTTDNVDDKAVNPIQQCFILIADIVSHLQYIEKEIVRLRKP